MLGFIKNIFRKRYLRKAISTNPTGLHPLSEIKSVSIIIDMEDSGADECKEKAISVFNTHKRVFFRFQQEGRGRETDYEPEQHHLTQRPELVRPPVGGEIVNAGAGKFGHAAVARGQ